MTGVYWVVDFAEVAEDLVLLAMHRRSGRIHRGYRLGYALMAVELAALEAAGCVRTVADLRLPAGARDIRRLIVADPGGPPAGSRELDAALASIMVMDYPPVVWQWLNVSRAGLVSDYLERLAASGVVERRVRRRLGVKVTRWRITSGGRLFGAQSRFMALAGEHGDLGRADALYVGLALAMEVRVRAGLGSRVARDRLEEISGSQWLVRVVARKIEERVAAATNAAAFGG